MTINTVNQAYNGLRPKTFVVRSFSGSAPPSVGVFTDIYIAGSLPAAAAPSPGLAGAALTSMSGTLPCPNAAIANYVGMIDVGGNQDYGLTYTATTDYVPTKMNYSLMLVDRLWHNSGLNATSTSVQTVNSVTWPARDINQSTNGEGVYLALENSSATTNSLDSLGYTVTVTYTNSAGTSGRTGTTLSMGYITSAGNNFVRQGSWVPIALQAGDTGVRSVQSVQFSSSYGAGPVLHLVAYRPLVMGWSKPTQRSGSIEDPVTLVVPELWDNTVLQTVRFIYSNYPPPNYQVAMTQE